MLITYVVDVGGTSYGMCNNKFYIWGDTASVHLHNTVTETRSQIVKTDFQNHLLFYKKIKSNNHE